MKQNIVLIVSSFVISILTFLLIALIADKMFDFKCYGPMLLSSFLLALLIINVKKKRDV